MGENYISYFKNQNIINNTNNTIKDKNNEKDNKEIKIHSPNKFLNQISRDNPEADLHDESSEHGSIVNHKENMDFNNNLLFTMGSVTSSEFFTGIAVNNEKESEYNKPSQFTHDLDKVELNFN